MNKFQKRYYLINMLLTGSLYGFFLIAYISKNTVNIITGLILIAYYHFRLKKLIFSYLDAKEKAQLSGEPNQEKSGLIGLLKEPEVKVVGEKAKGQYSNLKANQCEEEE